jgi:hypothetical protein
MFAVVWSVLTHTYENQVPATAISAISTFRRENCANSVEISGNGLDIA